MANPVEIISPTGNKLAIDAAGEASVVLAAGSAIIGKVGIAGANVTPAQKGSTITLGGTAQNAIATNASRGGFWIQNQSAGPLYFSSIATAGIDNTSMLIPAGALYECQPWAVPTGAISIIGATTGQAFAAREW